MGSNCKLAVILKLSDHSSD